MENNKKFYQMTIEERRTFLDTQGIRTDAFSDCNGLSNEIADHMIENVIGTYALPIGLAQNFIINGKAYQIPMVIEEPSVVAGASNAARIAMAGGGFIADADEPRMIGQMQIIGIEDLDAAKAKLEARRNDFLAKAAEIDPFLIKLGGGPVDMEVRTFPETDCGPMLVLHLIMDVRDAMGANAINTALEKTAPLAEAITGGQVRLRILSNLADRRLARARCCIPSDALRFKTYGGADVRDRILEAAAFAEADPYRAATHNKGIMNGIDAVVLATGNDWRAIEAGAYAYASRNGRLRPLSHWHKNTDGDLIGEIELPIAAGTVGGATRVHPGAAASLKLLGVQNSRELASVMAAVGLAQNLAALKALSTEGIQQGHMSLHAKQVAMAAGAVGSQIDEIAAKLIADKQIFIDHAKALLDEMAN